MAGLSQLAKRAIVANPALFGWVQKPYADYRFWKKRSRLAARYRSRLQSDPHARQDTAFSIGHEPTLRCNLACSMCYQRDYRDDQCGARELSLEQMIAAYDRVNVADVNLVGSEIFMRKDIYDLLDYLRKRRVPVSLTTNGTLLDARGIERLRQCDNIEWIGVSVDGSEPVHNAIRGRSYAFARTVKAIREMLPHFRVTVSAVILEENMEDLPAVLHLCKQLGVRLVKYVFEEAYTPEDVQKTQEILQRRMGWSGNDYEICNNIRDDFGYSFERLASSVEGLKKEGRRLGVFPALKPEVFSRSLRDYYHGTTTRHLHMVCGNLVAERPTFRLDHQGNVHHCSSIRRSFGSLLEQPADEIWNSEEYRRFRALLMNKDLLPICKRCCKADCI